MKRLAIFALVVTLQACTTYQGYPAFVAMPSGTPGVTSASGVNIWSGTVNGQGFTVVSPVR